MFTIISIHYGAILVSLSIFWVFGPQGLKLEFPGAFSDPIIKPLFEFDWHTYLCTKKRVSHVTPFLISFIYTNAVFVDLASECSHPLLTHAKRTNMIEHASCRYMTKSFVSSSYRFKNRLIPNKTDVQNKEDCSKFISLVLQYV